MKKLILIVTLFGLILPFAIQAQDQADAIPDQVINVAEDELFQAKVIQILDAREVDSPDGETYQQQNLLLEGTKGEWKGKQVTIEGISDIQIVNSLIFKKGDQVIVAASPSPDGEVRYYLVDAVRSPSLTWLTILFVIIVLIIGKWKGLRALIVLGLSAAVILWYIVPQILKGADPLVISVVGGAVIMALAIFFTEGYNRHARLAYFSILILLAILLLLSKFFTLAAHLTGLASEEAIFISALQGGINVEGLLLAGMIIGTLGALDDVILNQIAVVDELRESNPELSTKELHKKAMRVGTTHISSIVNTLFLAYAGASLPLLVLFSVHEAPFLSFSDVINSEVIATEIVRTLVGSIVLVLAVPLATFLAVRFYDKTHPTHGQEANAEAR
ncbi:MAG: YibE/F family protein [Candidatus Nomurabacteria bacterium]|nr:MAG: YibE/F family protein [Candidatus Nomurabacteria bacterium]